MKRTSLCLLLLLLGYIPGSSAQQPPYGLTYELRQLHDFSLLPQYRDDTKLYQISSYDTTGGNNDGFSGTYSFVRKEGNFHVLADLKGPGVVNRIATPTPT